MNVNATLYAASSTDNDDCGKQKGCLDCEDGCLISWIPSKDKKTVHFEFSLPTKSENAYVAMGISPEPQMDGDHVIECVQGNSVHILRMSHNTGHHNQLIPVPPGVINNPNISYVDGILKCKFSSPVNSETTALPALDQAWYLEYAVGDVKVKGKELVKQFHSRKAASNSKVKLTEVTVIENSTPALVKLHVFMMVIAWMLFNNLAINIARNYKDLKPDCTLLGAKIWFQLHRLLIALTALFTLIGIIAIFVHVNGFTFDSNAPGPYMAHPLIGLLIVVLVLTNIFLGLLRPDLKSRDRPFFNIIHRSVGMTCQILSIASICTGAYILNSYTDLIYGLMIFYVVYMVLLNIMLFIIDKYYLNNNRKCRDKSIDKLRIFKNLLLPIHSVIQLVLAAFVASYAVAGD
ncbi:putative ferric-chelate reductase 1 [Octopus sinensis]|uniref:Ferric-chelate reductase 1 n=1 Tax=Octopus sinensis TaxID=2607531 RepID=A0A7E6FN74_9MOLL|nr:putative ferric-chelate reductase 1 [Octopus sinensis]